MIELDHIKALDLLELALEGNPVCDTFEDQANYIRLGYPCPQSDNCPLCSVTHCLKSRFDRQMITQFNVDLILKSRAKSNQMYVF